MIEILFLLFGLGFSVLVYISSIRTAKASALAKLTYFVLSLIGITGILLLLGVMIAPRIRALW